MPDELFRIVAVDAGNAHHVGTVFRTVYGEEFPAGDVYEPEILWREIKAGRLVASLILDAEGEPAGYLSMFKTAPNSRLWESGAMAVDPKYARTEASSRLADFLSNLIENQTAGGDGVFIEAVCSHYYTQFGAARMGMIDCGLELDQLDGGSFKDGKSNKAGTARVSCILTFKEMTDPKGPGYLPVRYDGIVRQIAASFRPRTFIPSTATLPIKGATHLEERYYPAPRTWKVAVASIGSDWAAVVGDIVNRGRQRGTISLQLTLNMALPHIDAAVEILREKGFFFGGFAPLWFGTDGLIMQRLFGSETVYDEIKLYSPIAKDLLAFIRIDRESVQA